LHESLSVRRRFQAAFGFAVLALAFTAFVNVQANRQRADTMNRVQSLRMAQNGTQELFEALVVQESAVQGFLATGHEYYLQQYATGASDERAEVTQLRTRLDGYRRPMSDLDAVVAASAAWRGAVQRDIAAQRSGQPDPDGDRVRGEQHKRLFDALDARVETLEIDTNTDLNAGRRSYDYAVACVTRMLYISVAVAGVLLGVLLLLVRRWVLVPLGRISSAVRAVSGGALDTPIPGAGPPELARLGNDVDAMRVRVLSEGEAALRANAALAEAEEELRLLVGSVRDGILRLDRDGNVTAYSAGFERITGYPASEMVGRNARDFTTPDEQENHHLDRVLAEAMAKGTAERQSWRRRADGSRFMANSVTTPIRDADGEIQGFAVVTRDVTAMWEAEQALAVANVHLADRAQELERTNELLHESNRALVAANRELEAFSYSVSHDLRAPLRAIHGFTRILVEEHRPSLDDKATDYLDRVAGNAVRMSTLIDDLLAFSKLRRSTLSKTSTSLTEVARSAWDELAPMRADQKVALRIAELPTLMADPRLLKQVFVNLLGNALKFSAGREPVSIVIESGTDPEGTGQPVITVRDNGIGFDPEHADRLFGVFKRLHADDYEGTGIGLSIVARIVARHGGRVWACAKPGEGASFSFTLGPDSVPGTSIQVPDGVDAVIDVGA